VQAIKIDDIRVDVTTIEKPYNGTNIKEIIKFKTKPEIEIIAIYCVLRLIVNPKPFIAIPEVIKVDINIDGNR